MSTMAWLVLALLLATRVDARERAPDWLETLAAADVPALAKDQPALVLLDEEHVTLEENGDTVSRGRLAVRVITRAGRDAASFSRAYHPDTAKLIFIRGFRLDPSGEVRTYGRAEIVDVLAAPNDVYNDVRRLSIDGSVDAVPGSVFGCEWTLQDKPLHAQLDWDFQGRLPTLTSRLILTLPATWTARAVTFNHDPIEPVVAGTTRTWELRDLPAIEEEPAEPSLTQLAPRVGVSLVPPEGVSMRSRTFASWDEVARWLAEHFDPPAVPTVSVKAKALELTSGAGSDMARLSAIARHVQAVSYISIQIGVGRGGGYRPHAASDVLAKNHGDCKDKVALARALLASVGQTAWPVALYSGDPAFVREEWPTPQQFNHAILAVKAPAEASGPAVVELPVHGRLLLFDPTDSLTPLGELPAHEQGGLALLVASEGGAPFRLPLAPPEANAREGRCDLELRADGSVSGRIHLEMSGATARSWRGALRDLDSTERRRFVEKGYARGVAGTAVTKLEVSDDAATGRHVVDIELTAPRFGQAMSAMLLLNPAAWARHETSAFKCSERAHPIVLGRSCFVDQVRMKLPPGWAVDELPADASLESAIGKLLVAHEAKDGEVVVTRRLTYAGGCLPAAECATVQSFHDRVTEAERAPVVLVGQ